PSDIALAGTAPQARNPATFLPAGVNLLRGTKSPRPHRLRLALMGLWTSAGRPTRDRKLGPAWAALAPQPHSAPPPPRPPPPPPPREKRTQRERDGASLLGGGGCLFSISGSSSNLWAV